MKDRLLKTFPQLTNPVAWFVFRSALELFAIIVMGFLTFTTPIGIMLVIFTALIYTKAGMKMAFTDPDDYTYKRKTDMELYTFLYHACLLGFIFAVATYQIFIHGMIFAWLIYALFMHMFTRVWTFHGKRRRHMYIALAAVIAAGFLTAPAIRGGIYLLLNMMGIY